MTRPRDIADGINRIDTSAADATAITIDASENVKINGGTLFPESTDSIRRTVDNSLITISGGDATNSGANYTLFGGTHSTSANVHRWRTDGTERLRITGTGDITTTGSSTFSRANAGFTARAGDSVAITRNAGTVLEINRSNDGTLVDFRSATVAEGNISVSGTTVSYNGGHLSRWSQLTDSTKDTSIVKGTVMTNLDAMVEWGDEANEQLNKMEVSSVEGDVNAAGVFVSWDEEDDWNDMNIAMTGDMVIRIAQGTTVARGDLLMSAGDGTAKPQGDDIVRSKTIAKVTSINVSHTYDDGSYLVPCVLMAC